MSGLVAMRLESCKIVHASNVRVLFLPFNYSMIIKSYHFPCKDTNICITFSILCCLCKEGKGEESCNYERYRVLVQNGFHGVSVADILAKINVEEMYPEPSKKFSNKSK